MVDEEAWRELNKEISKLAKEHPRLKNRPKPFETEAEKEVREVQLEKGRDEIWRFFDSLKDDFEKKRNYVLKLRKEIESLKVKERKDELEQKLIDQNITDSELLELQALNNILQAKT
jgi:hypothetical protein